MTAHHAVDVGDDSSIKFWGEVPRRGDRVLLGARQIRAKVIDVEWSIQNGKISCATIYYERQTTSG